MSQIRRQKSSFYKFQDIHMTIDIIEMLAERFDSKLLIFSDLKNLLLSISNENLPQKRATNEFSRNFSSGIVKFYLIDGVESESE